MRRTDRDREKQNRTILRSRLILWTELITFFYNTIRNTHWDLYLVCGCQEILLVLAFSTNLMSSYLVVVLGKCVDSPGTIHILVCVSSCVYAFLWILRCFFSAVRYDKWIFMLLFDNMCLCLREKRMDVTAPVLLLLLLLHTLANKKIQRSFPMKSNVDFQTMSQEPLLLRSSYNICSLSLSGRREFSAHSTFCWARAATTDSILHEHNNNQNNTSTQYATL